MSRYSAPEEEREGGWPAVQRLLTYAVGAHDRSQGEPDVPEELSEWPRTMLPAVAVGSVLGGVQQWKVEQQRAASRSPSLTLQRFFRISDSAIRGSLALGGLAAVYFTVHAVASVYRGRRSFVADGFYGGLAVGAVYGAHCAARSPTWPPAGNLPGRVATIICVGTLQGILEGWYSKQTQEEAATAAAEAAKRERAAALAASDPAAVLLAQLEASLSAKASPEQREGGEEEEQQAAAEQGEQEQQPEEQTPEEQTPEEQRQAAAAEQEATAAPAKRWRWW